MMLWHASNVWRRIAGLNTDDWLRWRGTSDRETTHRDRGASRLGASRGDRRPRTGRSSAARRSHVGGQAGEAEPILIVNHTDVNFV